MWPGAGPGGGGAGGSGNPGIAQFNNQGPNIISPAVGGGIDWRGRPWTGGSIDPKDNDYHLGANAKPHTLCCLRTEKQE